MLCPNSDSEDYSNMLNAYVTATQWNLSKIVISMRK